MQLWDAVDADGIAGHLYYLALVLLGPSLVTHLFLAQVLTPSPSLLSPLEALQSHHLISR